MGRSIATSLRVARCLSLLISTSISCVESIPELVQVHVIARHGSRVALETLPGQEEEVLEATSAILTPFGEKQLYDLGTWLRNRYAVADTLLAGNYVTHEVHFESSNWERTISSANVLSMILFPPATTRVAEDTMLPSNIYPGIPVYMHDGQNDIFIQAHDKCPTFDRSLDDLYASESWKQLEADNRSLLTRLGQLSLFKAYANGDGYVPLSVVSKAFDVIHMAKNECAASSSNAESVYCQFNPLDDTAWAELQALTHTTELARYSNVTARDLLGTNLLFLIHERMGGDVSKVSRGTSSTTPTTTQGGSNRKFHFYSAHYETILSVFAALNISPPINEVIPGYGAALIFEFYNDPSTGEYSLYMLYKEANSSNDMTIRFPDGPCKGGVSCPLPKFTELLSSMSYTSLAEWCIACGNESADVCLEVKLDSLLQQVPSGASSQPFAPTPTPAVAPTVEEAPHSLLPQPMPTPTASQTETALSPTASQQEEQLPVGTVCATSSTWFSALMTAGAILGGFLGGVPVGMLLLKLHNKKMARKRRKEADAELLDPDDLINLDYSDRIT